MSVTISDLRLYGAANMPEVDGSTTGGAVDFTKGVDFSDISPNGTMNYVSSSGSDLAVKISVEGRDATGVTQVETRTLNGTTPVAGAQTFARLLAGVITGGAIGALGDPGGTAAVGNVAAIANTATISGHTMRAGSTNTSGSTAPTAALQTGDGATAVAELIIRITAGTGAGQIRKVIANSGYGTDVVAVDRDWGTIPDNTSIYSVFEGIYFPIAPNSCLARTRLFSTTASDAPGGSTRYYYEKIFVVNDNTATAFTPQGSNSGVAIEVASESPSLPAGALLDAGLAAALNDTATITNRQTAPGGISFTTQPANLFVPSPGNLPPGAAPNAAGAMAVWLRLTLPAGTSPYKGAATIQTAGATV